MEMNTIQTTFQGEALKIRGNILQLGDRARIVIPGDVSEVRIYDNRIWVNGQEYIPQLNEFVSKPIPLWKKIIANTKAYFKT